MPSRLRKKFPARILRGWQLKPYAILHSAFREVLLLDADNVPVVNPEFLFDAPQFRAAGAVFWPDYKQAGKQKAAAIWRSCGLRQPREPEFETGQILVDKDRCWAALCLTLWFNENSDFYYRYVHGDKETFHLAFRKLDQSYCLVPTPIHPLPGTMCQHDFQGRRLFQHRNTDKWDPLLSNRRIEDFWFEQECRDYLVQLQGIWNGSVGNRVARPPRSMPLPKATLIRIGAVMISCPERDQLRQQTLANLARTDWDGQPVQIQMDEGHGDDHGRRQAQCAWLALNKALEAPSDYILFLEDDLDFNRHIRHNLLHWRAVRTGMAALASLYNPSVQRGGVRFPKPCAHCPARARLRQPGLPPVQGHGGVRCAPLAECEGSAGHQDLPSGRSVENAHSLSRAVPGGAYRDPKRLGRGLSSGKGLRPGLEGVAFRVTGSGQGRHFSSWPRAKKCVAKAQSQAL